MRLLVGRNLIGREIPLVKVTIVLGGKLNYLLDPEIKINKGEFSCGEIENSSKMLMYNSVKKICSAEFENLMVKGLKRDKKGKHNDYVTEERYSLLFMTEFTLDNINFQLSVGSIPLVVISHPSQKTKALASLQWANCGESFVDEDYLSWGQVRQQHFHPF